MTASAPPSPPSTGLQMDTQAPYYKWLVMGIIMLSTLTQTFAGNSVNLAIPRLMAAFGTDLGKAQWITTGFLITRALIVPILGWLGGALGNRNLFVICMVGFVFASAGCGLATELWVLVGFRLMQGLVMGPMEGLSAVFLLHVFPPHQRGLALGFRMLGASIGHVISFTLGGYFIEQVSWRLIFFMGLPTGFVAAVLGGLMLPQQQREYQGRPVDYLGLLFLGIFLIPLLLAISFGRNNETALSTLMSLSVLACLGGGAFILRELLATYPAVNLRLFRLPAFCCVCSTAFFNNLAAFGSQFMIPIFLQQVLGFTPLQAGLVMIPAIIVSGLSGVASGRLSDLIPPPLVVLASLATLVGVFHALATVTPLTAVGILVVYIMLYRVCMFGINTPLTVLNARILGLHQIRMGQGLMGVVRNIGAGLGVTMASVVFERRRLEHQLLAYHTYNDSSSTHRVLLDELKHRLHDAGMVGAAVDRTALRTIQRQMDIEAIAAGFRDTFLFISVCFLLAILPMLWILRRHRQQQTEEVAV